MARFIPLKRSVLPTVKIGTTLYGDKGEIYTFVKYDDSNACVGVDDETESFKWKRLDQVSLKGDTMNSMKEYLEKHRDVFLTIGIVLILDHFVFEGAFREKLKSITESFLDKKTKELTDGK